MYIPDKYKITDWDQQKTIIKDYPLGTLITFSPDSGLIANHIPFNLIERDGKKILQAHMAKVNHQLPYLRGDDVVLVTFQSSDSYITPSYYKSKETTHKVVPTWDFAAVHCHGKPTLIDNYDYLRSQHNILTNEQEAGRDKPWTVDEAPEKYYTLLTKAIIGLEIEVTSIEAKFKFEQKMKPEDIDGVIKGLAEDKLEKLSTLVKDANINVSA